MSGKPHSNTLIHHTIHKIKSHWNRMSESIEPSDVRAGHTEKWFSQMAHLKQLSFHNSICIALWDMVANRFLFAIDERKITGYDVALYTAENGVDFSLANFHSDHIHGLHLFNQCAYECMQRHRTEGQIDRMMINMDAHYRVADDSYIHILQQIVPVETDSHGNPYLFLSYIRDISHLKKHMSASLVFTTRNVCVHRNYNLDKRELEVVTLPTNQEKRVLELLGEGKQSRHIAAELSLSHHTVDTHRRHLLAKTNCVDTTALSTYFQLIGLAVN